MPWIRTKAGLVAHVKMQQPRRTRCRCGSGLFVTLLCDGVREDRGGTCDAKLCRLCTTRGPKGEDYCARCSSPKPPKQGKLL